MADRGTETGAGWANKGNGWSDAGDGRLEVNARQSDAAAGRASADGGQSRTADDQASEGDGQSSMAARKANARNGQTGTAIGRASADGGQLGMDEGQTMRSILRDDAYTVQRVLADGPAGRTELVMLDDEGPLVRKRIPSSLANVSAWAVAMEVDEPLLPRIEELYRMPDALVVVYDYVPGKSLRELVEADGRMSAERATDIICDVCHSVGVLHEHGVIHRDITPGNVIAASDGAHLVDLGIARQSSEGQRRDTTTLGTWGYAAPEQYGFAQTDARSDVYGIGRLLGYLLTGVTPGDDAYEQALDALTQTQESLVQVVRRATTFEPSARYQSAAELADAVRAAASQQDDPDSARRAAASLQDDPAADPRVAAVPASTFQPNAQRSTRASAKAPQAPVSSKKDGPVTASYAAAAQSAISHPGPATSKMPVRLTRAFSEAPLWLRMLAVVLWFFVGGFAVLTVVTSIAAVATGNPPWKAGHQALAWAVVAFCAAVIRETYLAVVLADLYNQAERPAKRYALTLLAYFGVLVLALAVIAALLPA